METSCKKTFILTAILPALWTILPGVTPLRADVHPATLFSNHMVIQRDLPVHVWGEASEGEEVTVSFRSNSASATTNKSGYWSVYLPPGGAGGPFQLAIRGNNTISLADVLVGDVWVASGQSNMGFTMRGLNNADSQIALAQHPNLRLFHVQQRTSPYPLEEVEAKPWVACSPQSVADFSAVAYFFSSDIEKTERIPIGVIESDWGGTPAEAWTSLDALTADPGLMPVFAARAHMIDNWPQVLQQERSEQQLHRGAESHGHPELQLPWHPDLDSWAPSYPYNAMIAPLVPFPIRGVIWYQGESNTATDDGRSSIYKRLFPTMIEDWRRQWGGGNFPFLFVQLANYADSPSNDWATVRDAQRNALQLQNTGMAVTIDIGESNNIHPKNKQDVGHRLALAARAVAYGEKIEYSGPLLRQVTAEPHALRAWFDHAESGLVARGGTLKGFEVAGEDRKFVSATASISGISVVVTSSTITEPRYVRYAWANDPECNLINGDKLPASPFLSEEIAR